PCNVAHSLPGFNRRIAIPRDRLKRTAQPGGMIEHGYGLTVVGLGSGPPRSRRVRGRYCRTARAAAAPAIATPEVRLTMRTARGLVNSRRTCAASATKPKKTTANTTAIVA